MLDDPNRWAKRNPDAQQILFAQAWQVFDAQLMDFEEWKVLYDPKLTEEELQCRFGGRALAED